MHRYCLYIVMLFIMLSFQGKAAQANGQLNKRLVDMKCHVELSGGQQIIAFYSVKENQQAKLIDRIVDKKINTPYSRQKVIVNKAFECVNLEKQFVSAKARDLYAKQPR